jgi:hypothetical protein
LELELKDSRSRTAAVEEEKASLELARDKWQRFARERAVIVKEIQSETWVRLGIRLGLVKQREDTSDSLAMGLQPEGAPAQAQDLEGRQTFERNWDLRAVGGNQADLVFPADDLERVRIDIRKAKTRTDWDIQLNRQGLHVTSNQRYAVQFRARADRSRRIGVGFARAHEPWTSLGLYLKLNLTPEWQTFHEEFLASADDDKARIHFDLGGRNIAVELTSVTLQKVTDSQSGEPVQQRGTLA